MKTMKKTLALTGAIMSLYAGGMLFAGNESIDACMTSVLPAVHAAEKAAWQDDIDKATRDDTMAFNIYIGKPIQTCIEEFEKNGWTRVAEESTIFYIKNKGDYFLGIALHPNKSSKELVGSYRIRLYAKTQDMADEMYMRAEKNFAYNFGRPSIKKGTTNATWFLNESFSIVVEYNEYDARMPIVRDFYPNEIVIKREIGDYKKFFEATK